MFAAFELHLDNRTEFKLKSYYRKSEGLNPEMGTVFIGNDNTTHTLIETVNTHLNTHFTQVMQPCQRLIIFGGEHDAADVLVTEVFDGVLMGGRQRGIEGDVAKRG